MSTTSTPPAQIVRGEQAAHAHARVVAAVPPHERCDYEYDTPQEVLNLDNDLRDAGVPIRRWILGPIDDPDAVAFCFRATWNTPRHTFWGHIRVLPHAQHLGIGAELLHKVQQWAATAGAQALRVVAHPGMSDAFLARHGFAHIGTEQLYTLELPLHTPIMPQELPAHIRLTTLAELLESDSDAMEQVCTLHAAISLDVPMPDELIVTLSKFRRLLGEDVNPAHYLLAFVDDQLIGESILMEDDDDAHVMWQHATGVLPAFRGLGVAKILKIAAIELAQSLGIRELRTWMETSNAPIRKVNHALGFNESSHPGSVIHIYECAVKNGQDGRG
jgi:GNAT superfamily N-acetyltransferase